MIEIPWWLGLVPMSLLALFVLLRLTIAGIITAAILFIPQIFMEDHDISYDIISGLRKCVVENNCPVNDSRVHKMAEFMQWSTIKLFNQNEGITIFTEWVILTIGLFFTRWQSDRPRLSI